jgi:hypothetical protein
MCPPFALFLSFLEESPPPGGWGRIQVGVKSFVRRSFWNGRHSDGIHPPLPPLPSNREGIVDSGIKKGLNSIGGHVHFAINPYRVTLGFKFLVLGSDFT